MWEVLLSRKSQDLEAKRKGCEGHRRAIGMSNNPGSQPSIVKVYVNESSHSRHRLRDEGSPSDSSSSDSSRHRRCCHHCEPAPALQSSPAQHNEVHLHSYKSWYNSKYSSGEDIVTEEQWDQMEGSMLSIATIKGGLTAGDWEHLGIALSTGKNLTRRVAVFEAKVRKGEWL